MNQIKDWIPLFTQLVWPLTIISLVLVFHGQIQHTFSQLDQAIGEGRTIQLGDWLKIGEKTPIATLTTAQLNGSNDDIDLSIDSVGGHNEYVERSLARVLDKLQNKLKTSAVQRIDVLLIDSNKRYSSQLLTEYITTLGVRYVIFEETGKFSGWIHAGVFNSQLPKRDQSLNYDQLHSNLAGIRQDSIPSTASAVEVLKAMDSGNFDNIAVVDNGKFQFIAHRVTIISKLLTTILLQQQASQPH